MFLHFSGERCEQCGLQDSTTYCANDGICTYLNKNPVCSCKPGFDNRTNCERKTCEGYCLNNAPCMIMKNNLYCKCSPGYEGERCETTVKDCSSIKCLNGGMYVLHFRYMDTLSWVVFYKGDNLCDFLFSFLDDKPFQKRVYS